MPHAEGGLMSLINGEWVSKLAGYNFQRSNLQPYNHYKTE